MIWFTRQITAISNIKTKKLHWKKVKCRTNLTSNWKWAYKRSPSWKDFVKMVQHRRYWIIPGKKFPRTKISQKIPLPLFSGFPGYSCKKGHRVVQTKERNDKYCTDCKTVEHTRKSETTNNFKCETQFSSHYIMISLETFVSQVHWTGWLFLI